MPDVSLRVPGAPGALIRALTSCSWHVERVVLYLGCSLLMVLTPHDRAQAQDAPDSATVFRSVVASYQGYLALWRSAWVRSENDREHVWVVRRWDRGTRKDGTVVFTWNIYVRPFTDTLDFIEGFPIRRRRQTQCRASVDRETPSRSGDFPSAAVGSGWSIRSQVSLFGVCPTWYLGPGRMPPWDERLGIDFSIEEEFRPIVREKRAELITSLRRGVERFPSNDWLNGQLVRVLVDQNEFSDALTAAEECAGAAWWCAMLRGYVLASHANTEAAVRENQQGRNARRIADLLRDAEFNYRSGLSAAPAVHRCALSGVAELLEPEVRMRYNKLNCSERDSINNRLWWLSAPLWSDGSNDRFVEHMTRRMLLQLRSAIEEDERFSWIVAQGNDARAEMVIRYGWPAYTYWRGPTWDSIYTQILVSPEDKSVKSSPGNAPYVSYEYGAGRTHTLPNRSVFEDALAATLNHWQLSAPPGGDTAAAMKVVHAFPRGFELGEIAPEVAASYQQYHAYYGVEHPQYVRNTLWWPVEHYASPLGLVQFSEPQVAWLRRQDSAIAAVALLPDSASVKRPHGASLSNVALVVTTHPDSILVPLRVNGTVGTPLRFQANVAPRPALLGVELAATDNAPAARTRLGITPPEALSAMTAAMRDISAPVILDLDGIDEAPPVETDKALSLMNATASAPQGSAIGIYWETYGFEPNDSVQLSVRVRRYTPPSAARRVAMALRMASDQNTPVEISWAESGSSGGARMVIEGPVPVIGRSLRLDLAGLPKGEYEVAVAVSGMAIRGGTGKAEKRTVLTIR